MIGAANSPMNMFTGGGNEAFQRGMMIGDANSPVSPIANAFKATIDKYNAHLSAQQEQQNKMDLLTHEYSLKRQGAVPDPDAGGPQIIKDPTTGKFFYGNSTVDSTTGQIKKSWTPVTNAPPTDEKKAFENSMYEKINAGMNGSGGGSPIPGVPMMPAAPQINGASKMPQYNPATEKLQQNSKGEYRVVPK